MVNMDLYNETMQTIENSFPAFAAEADTEDLHTTKVAFYNAMIEGLERNPRLDPSTKNRVRLQLSALRYNSEEIIADREEN